MAARAGAHVKRGIVLALQVQFVVVSGKQMVNLGLSDPRGVGLLHALQVGPKLFGVIAGLNRHSPYVNGPSLARYFAVL